jgi:LuxR family maltose regulon positive regulatory protein
MDTMNSQVVALVVGLLRAARSNATFQKILEESPHLNELLDPLQGERGAGQPGSLLPDAARPLQGSRSVPQSHDRAARGLTPPGSLSLSPRQYDILILIALGRSNKEIARITGITPETVKTHVKNIFTKLSVEKRAQAVARAHTLGLVDAHAECSKLDQ